jgi:deoxyribodipyrimidine photolyase-related protein
VQNSSAELTLNLAALGIELLVREGEAVEVLNLLLAEQPFTHLLSHEETGAGWREYVRGIYWTQMPAYLELNAHSTSQPLPAFYWTGKTDMKCMNDAIGQTLAHGYAHHIQRL